MKFKKVVKREVECNVWTRMFGLLSETSVGVQFSYGIDKVAITSDGRFYAHDSIGKDTARAVIPTDMVKRFIKFFETVDSLMSNVDDCTLDIVTYDLNGNGEFTVTLCRFTFDGVVMTVEQ